MQPQPNGWRCAALPGPATDAQMRRGRAGAELRHKAPTTTWRRAEGAGATPQASHAHSPPRRRQRQHQRIVRRASRHCLSRTCDRRIRFQSSDPSSAGDIRSKSEVVEAVDRLAIYAGQERHMAERVILHERLRPARPVLNIERDGTRAHDRVVCRVDVLQ